MGRLYVVIGAMFLGARLSAQSAPPPLPAVDRVRITEAHHVAAAVADSVWPAWSGAPFAMVLITPTTEFLVAAPAQGSGWSAVPFDTLFGALIHSRARQFPPAMQATFPFVNGINTIVIGEPPLTSDKNSPRWLLTVMHEHFHQWVYSQPWYYAKVATLGLDHGDKSGMWMLNYPFPYDSADVRRRFTQMTRALRQALIAPDGAPRAAVVSSRPHGGFQQGGSYLALLVAAGGAADRRTSLFSINSQLGWPSSTLRMFRTVTSAIRAAASRVRPATWGAARKLGNFSSGLSSGGGSWSKTSSAAPASLPDDSAS